MTRNLFSVSWSAPGSPPGSTCTKHRIVDQPVYWKLCYDRPVQHPHDCLKLMFDSGISLCSHCRQTVYVMHWLVFRYSFFLWGLCHFFLKWILFGLLSDFYGYLNLKWLQIFFIPLPNPPPVSQAGREGVASSPGSDARLGLDVVEGGRTALDNKTSLLNTPSPRSFSGPRTREFAPYGFGETICTYDKSALKEAVFDDDVEQFRDCEFMRMILCFYVYTSEESTYLPQSHLH